MTDKNFCSTFSDPHRRFCDLTKSRLKSTYFPFIEPLRQLYPDGPALNLGRNREECLELLTAGGFAAHDIDLNEEMPAVSCQRGLIRERQDAPPGISALADASQVVVSAFHLVEHLPLEAIQTLISEAFRVLKPGGILILETSNPKDILASTPDLNVDMMHQYPIPLYLLSFLAEYYGFARIKALELQESPDCTSRPQGFLPDILGADSHDYAIIAQKSGNEEQMALTSHPFAIEDGMTLDTPAAKYDRQTESRVAQAESRALHAELELRAVYASPSWRLTRPWRYAADLLRHLRYCAHRLRHNSSPSGPSPLTPHIRRLEKELLAAIERSKKEAD